MINSSQSHTDFASAVCCSRLTSKAKNIYSRIPALFVMKRLTWLVAYVQFVGWLVDCL